MPEPTARQAIFSSPLQICDKTIDGGQLTLTNPQITQAIGEAAE
jgi:hypothetical protein